MTRITPYQKIVQAIVSGTCRRIDRDAHKLGTETYQDLFRGYLGKEYYYLFIQQFDKRYNFKGVLKLSRGIMCLTISSIEFHFIGAMTGMDRPDKTVIPRSLLMSLPCLALEAGVEFCLNLSKFYNIQIHKLKVKITFNLRILQLKNNGSVRANKKMHYLKFSLFSSALETLKTTHLSIFFMEI